MHIAVRRSGVGTRRRGTQAPGESGDLVAPGALSTHLVSMPDPITRLNAALEGRYTIDREFGEGGLATVYWPTT